MSALSRLRWAPGQVPQFLFGKKLSQSWSCRYPSVIPQLHFNKDNDKSSFLAAALFAPTYSSNCTMKVEFYENNRISGCEHLNIEEEDKRPPSCSSCPPCSARPPSPRSIVFPSKDLSPELELLRYCNRAAIKPNFPTTSCLISRGLNPLGVGVNPLFWHENDVKQAYSSAQ